MQNISIDTLYSLLDKFDTLKELLTKYGTALLIAAAVFALLNCFFGYTLRKFWSVLLGFGIGAAGGMLLATYTDQSYNMILGVTVGLGLIFGLLALLLYRIGTFFLIIGFLGFSLYQLLQPKDLVMLLFLTGISVVVALIGVPFERITVILITSVCGALTAVTLAYDLQKTAYDPVMWIIILILAALGMVFQFKPWKDRWYQEEEEEPDEYRHRKRKASSRKSAPSRRRSFGTAPKKKVRRKVRTTQKNTSRPRPSKVSQNTMYDFRFVPEEPDDDDDFRGNRRKEEPHARRPVRNVQPPVQSHESESPAPSPGGTTRPVPDLSSGQDLDLSQIRQQISEEVQEIYRDSQNNDPS